MSRMCTTCGRVVAEAAYCPFCSELTTERPKPRKEALNRLPKKEEFERRALPLFWNWLLCVFIFLMMAYNQYSLTKRNEELSQKLDQEYHKRSIALEDRIKEREQWNAVTEKLMKVTQEKLDKTQKEIEGLQKEINRLKQEAQRGK